jgi:hypothetical protein
VFSEYWYSCSRYVKKASNCSSMAYYSLLIAL